MLRWRRIAVSTIAACSAASAAYAEILRDLPEAPSWTFTTPADDGCKLAAPTKAVQFVVRNSPRQIGPYSVTLPGYAGPARKAGAFDPYGPFLITAQPGDAIGIDLKNDLGPPDGSGDSALGPTNLHTHGLVTKARPYSRPCNSPGDYIFNAVQPGHDLVYNIGIPTDVDGIGEGATGKRDVDGDKDGSLPFPVGVYWVHAHIHGAAKDHVGAGQAALLDVLPDANSPPQEIDLDKVDTKYLALRDLQVQPDDGTPPTAAPVDDPSKQTAKWLHGKDYDPALCQGASAAATQIGYCQGVGDKSNAYWIFTVNGQLAPEIEIDSGKFQRWKIANLSPLVTYMLEIVGEDCENDEADKCKAEPFSLVKLDGVVTEPPALNMAWMISAASRRNAPAGDNIATPPAAPQTRKFPEIPITRLLLPPASRAEIIVANSQTLSQDRKLVLRTREFDGGGDVWPQIRLARVTFKKGAEASGLSSFFDKSYPVPSYPKPESTPASTANTPAPHNCIVLPDNAHRRLITFESHKLNPDTPQEKELFEIGSDIVDAAGHRPPDDNDPNHIGLRVFEHGEPPLSLPHVCAKLGTGEFWEVINTTPEIHNFHIHQTKFRLATKADADLPGSPLPRGLQDDQAYQDPGHAMRDKIGESYAPTTGVNIWHDTLLVPPAEFEKDGKGQVIKDEKGQPKLKAPGRIFVYIPFKDEHQVGVYVFHCHILEHEDGGMMATIEVYDPADPDANGKAARYSPRGGDGRSKLAAYCGAPPKDAALFGLPPESGWLQSAASRLFGATN
jgi:FtsP/CotA-like multicopper oxidase with cupredoxin domain